LRQGLPPQATYLFKHALVQDAAYGTLLREQRRVLHAHIAATLESQFAEIAEAAGTAGASLHRGRPDREGRQLVGNAISGVPFTAAPAMPTPCETSLYTHRAPFCELEFEAAQCVF
jgi:hypothetical protein